MENLVSISQAATHLAVKVNTLRLWVKEKNLPHYRTGCHLKFLPSELLNWAKQQAEQYMADKEKAKRPTRGRKGLKVV